MRIHRPDRSFNCQSSHQVETELKQSAAWFTLDFLLLPTRAFVSLSFYHSLKQDSGAECIFPPPPPPTPILARKWQ